MGTTLARDLKLSNIVKCYMTIIASFLDETVAILFHERHAYNLKKSVMQPTCNSIQKLWTPSL